MEQSSVKILAISDVPSELLWDESVRRRLEGIDLILSCGDLPKKYLEYLTNFTAAPILYVHGNHDGSYKGGRARGLHLCGRCSLCLEGTAHHGAGRMQPIQ